MSLQENSVTGGPRRLLRLEAAGALALAVWAYAHLGGPWWAFAVLFFVPDLSMLGYLAGPRVGARAYNAVHNYIGPLALLAAGEGAHLRPAVLLGLIWAGHIGFDRLLGYGLKYPEAFTATHLGRIGAGA